MTSTVTVSPGSPQGDLALQLRGAADRLPLHAHDHVTGLDAGTLGGAVLREVLDEHPGDVRQAVDFRVLGIHALVDRDAERGAAHLAVADQVVGDASGEVDRHGEPVAEPATHGLGHDRCVHPDHLAAQVHERTARVALVDRGVGLDEVLDRVVRQAPGLERLAEDPERPSHLR
jgi:hypothetical protein